MSLTQPIEIRKTITVFPEIRQALKKARKPHEHFWQTCDRIIRAGLAAEAEAAADKKGAAA